MARESAQMANSTAPAERRDTILDEIAALRSAFEERRLANPPPTSALQSAYELRMQQLYDALDATEERLDDAV